MICNPQGQQHPESSQCWKLHIHTQRALSCKLCHLILRPVHCRNVGCLLAVLPSHLQFGRYMWSRARASATAQLVALPAAILALVVTDLQTLRVAAVLGLAMCGGQFLSMRHVQHVGQKLI
jgi:hypothetical protein